MHVVALAGLTVLKSYHNIESSNKPHAQMKKNCINTGINI